jgi:MFS family permease
MAAPPAGTALGAYLILRVRPELRVRLIGPLALLSGVPLVLCGLHPGLLGATLLWAALGVLAAYQVPAAATFVRLVPPARRGQVFGLIGAAMTALQGFGIVVFGVLAEHLGAAHAIALAGVVAALMAGGFVTLLRRAPVRDVT